MLSIELPTLLAFATACFVIELTPGPNMAYLAVLSASRGRRAGVAAVLGVALGLFVVGLAAALGLAAIITNSHFLYESLRWGGVAYLIWLAWEAWESADETSPGRVEVVDKHAIHFRRGLITNLLNPKAGIFYVAILPTFIEPSRGVVGQTITLSAILCDYCYDGVCDNRNACGNGSAIAGKPAYEHDHSANFGNRTGRNRCLVWTSESHRYLATPPVETPSLRGSFIKTQAHAMVPDDGKNSSSEGPKRGFAALGENRRQEIAYRGGKSVAPEHRIRLRFEREGT